MHSTTKSVNLAKPRTQPPLNTRLYFASADPCSAVETVLTAGPIKRQDTVSHFIDHLNLDKQRLAL